MINHVHKSPAPPPRIVLDYTVAEAEILMKWIDACAINGIHPQVIGDTYDALYASLREVGAV